MADRPQHRQPQPAMTAAVGWFVRRDTGPLTAAEQAAFDAWFAADAAHRNAYVEVVRLWGELGAVPMPAQPARRPAPRAWRWGAVGAVAAACLLLLVWSDLPLRLQADAMSGTGETRTVALPDGSIAVLNTASAIAIDYGPGERRVRLLRGEAEFKVAKDPGRPFRVDANGGVSTALGTVFLVRRHAAGATVTVLESRVAVSRAGGPAREAVLGENQQVTYGNGLGPVEPVDAQAAASWLRGKLIFAERPLGEVIDELNRYHRGQIRVLDDTLRHRKVSGVFETRDPVAVIDALEKSLGLRSTRLSDLLILLHR